MFRRTERCGKKMFFSCKLLFEDYLCTKVNVNFDLWSVHSGALPTLSMLLACIKVRGRIWRAATVNSILILSSRKCQKWSIKIQPSQS